MAQEKISLLFFGTSTFAVETLKLLEKSPRVNLLGVVCPPDQPQGRGRKIKPRKVKPSVTKAYCDHQGLRTFQPQKLSELKPFLDTQQPQGALVVAYGKIFPRWILDESVYFPQGIYNVHASLLPRHRGAAPIQGALLSGDSHTGLAIQKMSFELDTGPVWLTVKTDIAIEDTFGSLSAKLIALLPALIHRFCEAFPPAASDLKAQEHAHATYTEKLGAKHWTYDVSRAIPTWNEIRAFIPYPGVWLTWGQERLFKVCEVEYIPRATATKMLLNLTPPAELTLSCKDDHVINIQKLQMPDKPKQSVVDWYNGHRSFIEHLARKGILQH